MAVFDPSRGGSPFDFSRQGFGVRGGQGPTQLTFGERLNMFFAKTGKGFKKFGKTLEELQNQDGTNRKADVTTGLLEIAQAFTKDPQPLIPHQSRFINRNSGQAPALRPAARAGVNRR